MTKRTRLFMGLLGALLVGALGPALASVASQSGSGQGTISGRITSGGEAASGLCASAWFAAENRVTTESLFAGSIQAGLDGSYTLRGLPADGYKVEFHDCDAQREGNFRVVRPFDRQSSYWPGERLYEHGLEIIVGPSEDVVNVNGDISTIL